jgi:N-acetylglucosamine-6-phosphate deacetylase
VKRQAIRNATILTPTGLVENGLVVWGESGHIQQISPSPHLSLPEHTAVLDGHGFLVAPGFIDLQLNGGFGHDFTADPQTIWTVAAQLPQFGVTRFLPTIISAPMAVYKEAQAVLVAGAPVGFEGARPLGLHFEGPFLNPGKKGAHNPDHLRLPNLATIVDWSPQNGVRLVTIAPELPGATVVISQLARRGVIVSAGHSLATVAEAQAGFEAGIRYGTHLFNAMPPLHHREPGLAGALLADEQTVVGLIADGVHIHPDLVRLVWQAVGSERLNLVTDGMSALAMPPGPYMLADFTVQVTADQARLPDGTLAGSVLSLDTAVRNLIRFTGCTLPQAVATVSHTPANLLNLPTGKIQVGYNADFVLLDSQLNVVKTIVAGKIVYDAEQTTPIAAHRQDEGQ